MRLFRRRPHRLVMAPDGPVHLWDRSDPGARRIEMRLPDGRRLDLTEALGGWTCAPRRGPAAPVRRTMRDAVSRAAGGGREREGWLTVVEEMATPLAGGGSAALSPGDDRRLARLRERAPGVYLDGPRARSGGGWYVFVGGLPTHGAEDEAWVTADGATPEEAARAALCAAERRVAAPPGG